MAQVAPSERLLLKVESVAAMLDLSEDQVYRLITSGHLPSVKVEGTSKRLVPRSELQQWITDMIRAQIQRAIG